MAQIIQSNEGVLYQCEECKLKYRDQAIAEKCQAWCKAHASCNLDFIKYAVQENENTPQT